MPSSLTSIVWGNVSAPVTFNFREPGDCQMYDYGRFYCLDGCEHTGIDIGLNCFTPLYAAADGTITCAGTGVGAGYDNAGCAVFDDTSCGGGAGRLELLLDDGSVAIYGHCATVEVPLQSRVARGQRIATSGGMNGPHLHFEYRVPNGQCQAMYAIVDPVPLLTGTTPPSEEFGLGDVLRATEPLNLRDGPGLGEPIIVTMATNTRVMVVSPSGPTIADGFHWYKIETRYGRGWAAGEYLTTTSPNNLIANPTANTNLDFIVANRTVTTIDRIYLDGSYRVRAVTAGTATVEGTRYLSDSPLNMHNERYFAGVINQVTGSPGKILDYIRVVAYFTDGTKKYSSPVIVHLTDDWKGVVSNTLTILPGKEIEQMALQATVENPEAMTFYTDNVWVVEI